MKTLFSALLGICCFAFNAYADDSITIYTTIESDRLAQYEILLQTVFPQDKIVWVRGSAGIITAKLLAEAKEPRADIVFGVAASSLIFLDQQNMFEPYIATGLDTISPNMRDSKAAPSWVGMYAWTSAFCVNTSELEKNGVPIPTSWQDLTKPEYQNLIAMPNPVSSGTGYMTLNAWIQLFGEKQAWTYAERLINNLNALTHSGATPCAMAARSQVAIGISSAAFAQDIIELNSPLEIIIPSEGTGWEIDALALIKKSPQKDRAKEIIDFLMISDQVAQLNANFSDITARAEFMTPEAKERSAKMNTKDLKWAAKNRTRLLKQWEARFTE